MAGTCMEDDGGHSGLWSKALYIYLKLCVDINANASDGR